MVANRDHAAAVNTRSNSHELPGLRPIWIAIGLAMGPAAALGLGRFAYALLLPAMRVDLGWSYAAAGAMNTANAFGYLAGALLTPLVARSLGLRRTFLLGLALTVLTLPASAASGGYVYLMTLRVLAGLTGALAFVCGASLATQVATDAQHVRPALVLAVYFAGPGLGVLLSSLGIPALLAAHPGTGWRLGWLALGVIGACACVLAFLAGARAGEPPLRAAPGARPVSLRPLAPAFVTYALFGVGYIAYMTFIIAFLRTEGAGTSEVSLFWALLGVTSILTVPAWGFALSHARGGRGMAGVLTVLAVGGGLPLLSPGLVVSLLSALLFGGSFLAVITAVTALARRALPPHAWAGTIAALTITFSLGQCVGPLLAGALADTDAGVRAGLALSAVILLVAALAAVLQRDQVYRPL